MALAEEVTGDVKVHLQAVHLSRGKVAGLIVRVTEPSPADATCQVHGKSAGVIIAWRVDVNQPEQ